MARPTEDLTGQRFGYWTVIARDGTIGSNAAWLCQCKRGHTRRIAGTKLRAGKKLQCHKCLTIHGPPHPRRRLCARVADIPVGGRGSGKTRDQPTARAPNSH